MSGTGTDFNTITVSQAEEDMQHMLYREIDCWDADKQHAYGVQFSEQSMPHKIQGRDSINSL